MACQVYKKEAPRRRERFLDGRKRGPVQRKKEKKGPDPDALKRREKKKSCLFWESKKEKKRERKKLPLCRSLLPREKKRIVALNRKIVRGEGGEASPHEKKKGNSFFYPAARGGEGEGGEKDGHPTLNKALFPSLRPRGGGGGRSLHKKKRSFALSLSSTKRHRSLRRKKEAVVCHLLRSLEKRGKQESNEFSP